MNEILDKLIKAEMENVDELKKTVFGLQKRLERAIGAWNYAMSNLQMLEAMAKEDIAPTWENRMAADAAAVKEDPLPPTHKFKASSSTTQTVCDNRIAEPFRPALDFNDLP